MNLRIKFLTFLAVFLLGSFLIITWKSFNIFSQKYTAAMGQSELQKLEVQASGIAQRFQIFQSALQNNKNVEAQLSGLGVQLLAHVINEEGKWKAQWFEGQPGARIAAQGATQQISFSTLSTTKKSWHLVNSKDLGSSLAYVIPTLNKNSVSFYVFFLTKDFFSRMFQGQSQLENISLVSPYLGEIYSVGSNPGSVEILEKNKRSIIEQQSGVIPIGKRSMMFLFNPDLQLYLVKTKKLAELSVDKPIYFLTLGMIMAILIGAALFAQDLLLRQVLNEEALVSSPIPMPVDKEFGGNASAASEIIKEGQQDIARANDKLVIASQDSRWERVIQQLRPHAINSLGYLNKLKASQSSPHMILLESELREMRRLIDPIEGVSVAAAASSVQPIFNPFSKDNFASDFKNKEFVASPIIAETFVAPVVELLALPSAVAVSDKNVLIRKPKRENNESRKL